jgi:hypothetical protein
MGVLKSIRSPTQDPSPDRHEKSLDLARTMNAT